MFIGILQGIDGEKNHVIGIFNNWIFDNNKTLAIPLCQEYLNYCCSTKHVNSELVRFQDGFLSQDVSNKGKINKILGQVEQNQISKISFLHE